MNFLQKISQSSSVHEAQKYTANPISNNLINLFHLMGKLHDIIVDIVILMSLSLALRF
jgi:hypothetical protein